MGWHLLAVYCLLVRSTKEFPSPLITVDELLQPHPTRSLFREKTIAS
jgi:hypothetical protein